MQRIIGEKEGCLVLCLKFRGGEHSILAEHGVIHGDQSI